MVNKSSSKKNRAILEVEINIDDRTVEKCTIYEGETPESVTQKIVDKHNLNMEERELVIKQLRSHI